MIKIVFFDFDGVLALQGHACSEICGYLEPTVGIPADIIEPVFHEVVKQLIVNGKRYENYINSINTQLGAHMTVMDILGAVQKSKLNKEMVQVLHELQENHTQVGILTDNNIERLEMIRMHPDFKNLTPIIGSSEVGCTKDKCDTIFIEALKQSVMTPEEILFIDNKQACLETPQKMGFHTYFHDEHLNDVQAFRAQLAHYGLL